MSPLEFESVVIRYVDGLARESEVGALRRFVASSPANRMLFRARVRLRRAQRGGATRADVDRIMRRDVLPGVAEFDSLSYAFLDGSATAAQVLRLRDALRASVELKRRFQARLRLHRAQNLYLRSRRRAGLTTALRSLSAYANRFGRVASQLCLLLLVFVELRVRVPNEYSGLMFSVESAVRVMPASEYPLTVSPDENELPPGIGSSEGVLPPMPMPEAGTGEVAEPGVVEA
ncbi:MAG: hypothetical protein ACO3ND_08945 [Opitutales bacterium]